MNILIDDLPLVLKVADDYYPVATDYRVGIMFEEAVRDPDLSALDKVVTALELYFQVRMPDARYAREAMEQILWFYRCGKDPKETGENRNSGERNEDAFSYEYDADYIYAAFLQTYGIDLTEKRLHWWQFQALFRALPEDTKIMKIIGYRTMTISSKLPKEQKTFYQKMKRLYRLPCKQKPIDTDLTELLMKGGNPSELLKNEDDSYGRRNT